MLILFPWPAVALADTVVLGDGDAIEGKVTEHGQSVRIEMDFGTVELPRSEIVRIERSHGKLRAFEARLDEAGDDVPALLELATWARTHGLERRARDVYRRVLILDPDNESAHRGLGHVKVEGRWLTETEAKLAAGYVRVGGVWLSPEEAAARRRFEVEPIVPAPPPVPGQDPRPTAEPQLYDSGWLTYWYPGWWGSWGYWRWAWRHHLRPRYVAGHPGLRPGQPGYGGHPLPPARPQPSGWVVRDQNRSVRARPGAQVPARVEGTPSRSRSGAKDSRGVRAGRSGASSSKGRQTHGRVAPSPRATRSF